MKLFRVIVAVSDIDAAREFYEELLGVSGMRVSPGRVYFDCGGVILACLDAEADGDDAPARSSSEPLYIATDDLVSVLGRARSAGAGFETVAIPGVGVPGEIDFRPWGERSFYCSDPFGNQLCFVDSATRFTG